jgi:hypothetical protein
MSVSCLVALPRYTWSTVWPVLSGHLTTLAMPCEWSIGLALNCSRLFTCLTGLDGVACPHVLQAIIAQAHVAWKHVSAPWKCVSLTI